MAGPQGPIMGKFNVRHVPTVFGNRSHPVDDSAVVVIIITKTELEGFLACFYHFALFGRALLTIWEKKSVSFWFIFAQGYA